MKDTRIDPEATAVSARYEKLYAMLLDAIPSSVLLISPNLRILSANRNFIEKSQKTLHDTIGRRIAEVFPAVILEQMDIARRVCHVLETNHSIQGERMTYRAPGVPIRIYYYSLLPFAWQGQTEGVLLLMNDVTEQVRLSEEVRRVERHLASIVDGASDLILSTDNSGVILTWNVAAEKLSGYSATEARGRKFSEFCADECQADIQAVLARVNAQNSTQIKECFLRTKQSASLLVSWVFSPLLDHASQTVGVVAVGRDLTERRKFEMELAQSQKLAALGVMAGGIAHEIRNPLAICSSAAQFLTDEDNITPEFLKECAGNIRRGIQRASAIIENLLRYARPATTNQTDCVNLVALIKETLDVTGNNTKIHKVKTELFFAHKEIAIHGSKTLLQQVFMNLFINAVNAMPDGGLLSIDVRTVAGSVIVRVSDSGCGIPKENIQKIFDPFYTTSSAGSGTGLGLAICYSVLKQHKGSIDVESIVGKGSTFTVKLPLSNTLKVDFEE
ncbi:MAG: ATP-binding protein [bacterium]